MLGWQVTVYRLAGTTPLAGIADVPALLASPLLESDRSGLISTLVAGEKLAIWQTGFDGLDWIDELIETKQAVGLAGNGYPSTYVALARDLIPQIVAGPPEARAAWATGRHDILTPGWKGKTVVEEEAVDRCRPDEWLVIEAWDES